LTIFILDGWEERWVKSTKKEAEGAQGKWAWTAGQWYNDENEDKGKHIIPLTADPEEYCTCRSEEYCA
jgi:hypothetical protein